MVIMHRWRTVWRVLLVLGAVGAAVGALYLLLVPFTDLIVDGAADGLRGKERFDAITSTRQLVLGACGGALAAVGVVVTARTYTTNKRGQVTDRYGKAVALLASDKLDERLGGLYALEHVMRESVTDHGAVVDVLVAFVREHSAERVRRPGDDVRPGPDIQTAVDIVGRRPARREARALDFGGAVLAGADFTEARLDRAVFTGAALDGARFTGASLARARFEGGSATRADFSQARLGRAEFTDVTLTGSVFVGTAFRGTRFTGCDLSGSKVEARSRSSLRLSGCLLSDLDWDNVSMWEDLDVREGNVTDPAADGLFQQVRAAIARRQETRDWGGTMSAGDE